MDETYSLRDVDEALPVRVQEDVTGRSMRPQARIAEAIRAPRDPSHAQGPDAAETPADVAESTTDASSEAQTRGPRLKG